MDRSAVRWIDQRSDRSVSGRMDRRADPRSICRTVGAHQRCERGGGGTRVGRGGSKRRQFVGDLVARAQSGVSRRATPSQITNCGEVPPRPTRGPPPPPPSPPPPPPPPPHPN